MLGIVSVALPWAPRRNFAKCFLFGLDGCCCTCQDAKSFTSNVTGDKQLGHSNSCLSSFLCDVCRMEGSASNASSLLCQRGPFGVNDQSLIPSPFAKHRGKEMSALSNLHQHNQPPQCLLQDLSLHKRCRENCGNLLLSAFQWAQL